MSSPKSVHRWGVTIAAALLVLAGCGGGSSTTKSGSTSSSRTKGGAAKAPSQQTGATQVSATAAASANAVSASAAGVTATLRASTHTPAVEVPWPVHFTVTRAGRPARADVAYEFLLAGQVVARRSHYRFTGSFTDIVKWPADAVGYPLTFRAVVTAAKSLIDLDYPVRVKG